MSHKQSMAYFLMAHCTITSDASLVLSLWHWSIVPVAIMCGLRSSESNKTHDKDNGKGR